MKLTRALTLFLALALLGFVLLALSAPIAHADAPIIVRVKVDGATSETCGSSWETACGLQYALSSTVASPSAELWVSAGTYTPTMGVTRTATFHLVDGIALYGGFAMTETLRSQRNLTSNVTILSGDLSGNDNSNVECEEPTRDENSYHVVTGSGVTNTAVLDGFTVTGGNGNDYYDPDGSGGGIYNNGANPTINDVTFISNTARLNGGGMYNLYSNPTVINVKFAGNMAGQYGGGMYNGISNPTLTNVIFFSNTATIAGGGMNNASSSPTLSNISFISNTVYNRGGGMYNGISNPTLTNITFAGNFAFVGGGMYNDTSNPTLINVTFAGNSAGLYGGGMANLYSSPTVFNVTFAGNSAYVGGAMHNYSSSPTICNAILWGNTAPSGSQIYNNAGAPNLSNSITQGGCPDSSTTCTHIITADPLLGALGHYGGRTQTIPFLPGSSAMDSGNDAICPATDQRGILRPQGLHCDIGAFELEFSRLHLPFIKR